MGIAITAAVTPKLGLVSHQNAVPLLRQLVILNDGAELLKDLVLELEPSLPFAARKTWPLDTLAAGESLLVEDRDIDLKEGYLSALVESVSASVTLRLRHGDTELSAVQYPVELLARNQWGGAGSMAELLAAFCMPNDPAVDHVLKAASDTLRRAGKPDGMDGYRSGARGRAWELASAIWSAVCGLQISYALPPASFELEGQKIRTPSQVFEGRVGTCLDTALLFAATLEQAGLNPVVVLTEGHVFTAVWLQAQEFGQLNVEEAAALRKRIDLKELVAFETTLATQQPIATFSQAIDVARDQLTDEAFRQAVDVRRARMQKLRPLSLTTGAEFSRQGAAPTMEVEAPGFDAAPDLPAVDVERTDTPLTPADKLDLWRRKLLDLTTRNRLLHVPESAKVIRLVCPDPAQLEDMLAANKSVRIVTMPDLEVGGRDTDTYDRRHREKLEEETARQAMEHGEVLSRMEKARLEAGLVELYRKARTDLEEGGSNTLFLAVGFLHWKKAESDPRTYRAPLILLPVKLDRRSVVSGVKMSMLDDEPRFNMTLLELLRHDFHLTVSGLQGDLPCDQSGIDVDGIWNIVRRAVRDMPGFEVVPEVVLGTFSFSKYLMWRDLTDRIDQLRESDVVARLLQRTGAASDATGGHAFGEFLTPKELDAHVRPSELFTLLPADSSQLVAIVASAGGQSFVLDGPPGTGKSQTIANMIAHNLALGRRVLFVAEKMAALDVVKRRLDAKGIGPFCLELHSSKSTKKHVLDQLQKAWQTRDALTKADWEAQADKVRTLRDHLNAVVEALHKRWPNGWSVYAAISLVVKDAGPDTPKLSWPEGTEHDLTQMAHLREVARKLDLNRAVLTETKGKLAFLSRSDWSNAWQMQIVACAKTALHAVNVCSDACTRFVHVTGMPLSASVPNAAKLLAFGELLKDTYGQDFSFAFSPELKEIHAAVQAARVHLAEFTALGKRLSQPCIVAALLRLDVASFQRDWQTASERFWLLAKHAQGKVAKALATAVGSAATPDVAVDLPVLAAMKAVVTKVDELDHTLMGVPGWAGMETSVAVIAHAIDTAGRLRTALVALAATPDGLLVLRRASQKLLVEGNDLLAAGGDIAQAVTALDSAYTGLTAAGNAFGEAAGAAWNLPGAVAQLQASAAAVVANERSLNAWCGWQRARTEALAYGLEPLVHALEKGSLGEVSAAYALDVAYARWFAATKIDEQPLLSHFVVAEQESDIAAYATAVDQLESMAATYVRLKLAGALPDPNYLDKRSGYAVLKYELQKQRRHKPVRQLIQEMGGDFTTLAPCMLMSPLSIAQYLPANQALFDLVIFDEASQIAPWDGVGAMARGKAVVIAGDPRQMPPTSFFNRGADDADDDTDEDLESILDECLGASVPQHSLSWHYRSRHESLITFSNYRYYGGNLVTFPAADTRASAVSWRRVDGTYARGKGGRRNAAEAQAIVAEVVARLRDPMFAASGQSIGVITLNADQQSLVNDLLDAERYADPALDAFFKEDLAEPVVVKNLETMQGDERDFIILGIGFGPAEPAAKTMSMNFGPLNREGGWRRLNVAASRARREMMVFTSFDPSMIDLGRTSARAVADLRQFIEFARDGMSAFPKTVRGSEGGYESPFEMYVAEGLRSKGWTIRTQVGVSRFRIDLGVVHPDRPGDYLVGVECDGATYHSAATARDRDKVRASILSELGWTLLRVWSTDWWVDRDRALDRLDAAIRAELATQQAKAAEEDRQRKERERKAARYEFSAEAPFPVVASGGNGLAPAPSTTGVAPVDDGQEAEVGEPDVTVMADCQRPGEPDSHRSAYRVANLSGLMPPLRPEAFQDASYDDVLEHCIKEVLCQEAPILDKVLVDRVARAHGFQRSGRLIRERVLELAKRHFYFQTDSGPENGDFVWLSSEDPARWNTWRTASSEGDSQRSMDEIPGEEIAAAVRDLAPDGKGSAVDIARGFGVRRLSAVGRERIERVMHGA